MKYHLESMLPIRAFSPRSGRARGFAAGGMTLESDGGSSNWWQEEAPAPSWSPEPESSVTVTGAPADAGGGGGGGVDQGALNAIYEQYLGRGVDPSGAATWAGQDPNAVIAGILGSQEYANRAGEQGGGGGGGGFGAGLPGQITAGALPGQEPGAVPTSDTEFVNKLYQDVLGRQADAGAQSWINALASGQMTAQDVANSFVSSQEAQQNKTPQTQEEAIANAIAEGYTSGGLGVQAPKVNGASEVANIYQNILGRAPDQGAQVWIDMINSGGSVADVANQIASSKEAQQRANASLPADLAKNDPNNFSQNLYQLYSSALGRAPTSAELAANVNAMNRDPDSFAWIAQQVTGSKEAQDRGAKYGFDPESVYQQVTSSYGHFTPTPEPGGLAGFANKIGPYAPFLMAAAALAAPAMAGTLAAEGAGAAAAGGAAAGGAGAAGTAAGGLTGNATLNAILAGAGKGALTGAAMGGISSGIQGGNIGQGILRGGLTGAVGGGIGGGFGGGPLANILGGTGAGAAGAALSGSNIGRGALMGGAGAGLNLGLSNFAPALAANPILSNAITGGALTSAMGGNFLKGAQAGAITGAVSPYVSSAYNTYFGGPTSNLPINPATGLPNTGSIYVGQGGFNPYAGSAFTPDEIAAGVGTPSTSGTPLGFAFTPQEIAAGVGTPQTSGISPADMQAAMAVTPPVTLSGPVAQAPTPDTVGRETEATRLSAATPDSPGAGIVNMYKSPNGLIVQEFSNGSSQIIEGDKTIKYNAAGVQIGDDGLPVRNIAEPREASVTVINPQLDRSQLPITSLISEQGIPTFNATGQSLIGSGMGNPNYVDPNAPNPFLLYTRGNVPLEQAGPPNPDEPGLPSLTYNGVKGLQYPGDLQKPEVTTEIKLVNPEEDSAKIQENKLSPAEKKVLEELPVTKEAKPVEQTPEEKKAEEQKKTEEKSKEEKGGAAEGEKVDEKKPGGGGNGVPLSSLKENEARIESVDKEKGTAIVVDKEGNVSKVSVSGEPTVGSKVSVKDLSTTSQQVAQPYGGTQAGPRTINYEDGSSITVDSQGNPIAATDIDGNPVSVKSEIGTSGEPGTGPGEGGGVGGGSGPGEGTGEGEGSGEGGGGGGAGGSGGAGGPGTGPGKGPGTTGPGKGPGIPYKLPTTTAGKGTPINLPGITNLTPGITAGDTNYELAGRAKFALGGSTTGSGTTSMGSSALDKYLSHLTPGLTEADTNYQLPGYFAKGGEVVDHNPEFFSEGGLGSLKNRYVKGKGDGTSDSIPAMLANGEFVIPADVVSSLGNGSNDSGAVLLDEFLKTIREHKRKADARHLPPDSKGALGYLLEAKKKAKK